MRAMRILGGVAAAALFSMAFAEPASIVGKAFTPPEASVFEDRSVPSTYRYDQQIWNFGFGLSGVGEMIGLHRFDAAGGSDVITSISAAWRETADGTTARVFVWQDNGSGNPEDATLLTEQNVIVANTNTGILNVYTLTTPVSVTGSFFVGFAFPAQPGTFPLAYILNPSPAYVNGRTFFGGTTTPPINPSNLGSLTAKAREATFRGYPGYLPLRASGWGSSFTYQGRLASNGTNYSGPADLIIRMYNAESGGNTVGPALAMKSVTVNAGVFTVQVPAEASMFPDAEDRFIDIQVRTPGETDYTTLTPRQRIRQVPMAMHATLASRASSADTVPWAGVTGVPASVTPWLPAAGGIAYNGGNVGIGTSNPIAPLHIRGGPLYNNALIETDSTLGTWLNLINTTGTGRTWALINTGTDNTEGAGAFLIRDNNVGAVRATFLPNGNVGLGTIVPNAKLDVRGDIRLGANGEYTAIGASAENLSIIRGTVNSNGTVRLGSGYTVTRLALGIYRVSWGTAPGFAAAPTPVATAYIAASPIVVFSSSALFNPDRSGWVEFRTVALSGVLTDSAFSFTLAGPR